ncbi:glycosyltransferase family 4 protein [Endothiovibrio diazotrophicus]
MDALSGRRVAVVTPTLKRQGGTEIYLERLLRTQRRLGIETRLFTTDPSPIDGDASARSSADTERDNPHIQVSFEVHRGRDIRHLADVIADGAHWAEFHHAVPAELVRAVAARVPTLLFLHTTRLTCPALTRHLPRSGQVCERPPGAGCWTTHLREGCLTGTSRLTPLTQRRAARTITSEVAAVVFNSEALRQLFETRITTLGQRARVLPPPHHFPRVGARPRAPHLLYVGRLFREKGVLDAVEATARLPGVPLHLYGAGRGEQEARALARRRGVDARFHGFRDDQAVADALASAGCLLLPSRLFEAWGMVGPEAIAQGCAVAAYDSGGIGEWLREPFGRRVAVGDVDALAAVAGELLARSSTSDQTTTWRSEAEARWGMERFAERYRVLIRDCLEGTA